MFEAEVANSCDAYCFLKLGEFSDKVFCHRKQFPPGIRELSIGDRLRAEVAVRLNDKRREWSFVAKRVELFQM